MERLRGRILQFAASWSSDQGKDGQERLESLLEMPQKQANENSDEITDEERLRRSLDSSVEADADNQTNAERLHRALGENDNDETSSFKATSIEPDEGNETDEERLQRALVMSMNENCCEEFAASKESSSNPAGRPILVSVVFIVWWLTCVARLQAARSERATRLGHTME